MPCTAQQSQQQEATAQPQAPRDDMAARALEFFGMLPKQGGGGDTTGPEVSNAVPLTASAGASASLQQFRQRAREAADASQAAARSLVSASCLRAQPVKIAAHATLPQSP